MIAAHLPILQVVLPLLAAPLCVLLRRGALPWLLSLAVCWLSLAVALALLAQVLAGGSISYHVGGWPPPWGIELRIDLLNAFVLLIVAAMAALTQLYAYASVRKEVGDDQAYLFYTAFLLALSGLFGIVATGDAFNLFVFIEISSLASYALISLSRSRRALVASYQYLIMGTIGATCILIGVGFLYVKTGTLNYADLAERLPLLTDSRTVRAAFAFFTVGVSLKLALFPLHLWMPNAYTYAPSVVSAFLAATTTKVFVYVLLRLFFTVFGAEFAFEILNADFLLLPLALAAVFVGSTIAIFQLNVKRLLAYSSVAQIGYMILGVSLVSVTGVAAGILHLFNHALMKCALFMALGCVFYRTGSVRLENMPGLGRQMPWTLAAFLIAGLSLVGVPLTVGFISKWYLVLAGLEQGWWWLAVLVLAASLLAVVYVWRVVEVAYFQASEGQAVTEAPPALLLPTWALVLANVYFGIDTQLTTGTALAAAKFLIGGGG